MRTLTSRLRVRENDADDPDQRVVEGIAVPYDVELSRWGGMFRERVAPGAVDLAALVGAPMLWRHTEPIGVWQEARDATVDGVTGPLVTGRISDTALGRDAYTLLRDAAVAGLSIGFDVITSREETVDGATVDVLTALDVREISLTPTPAWRDARVTAVREREPAMPTDTPTLPVPAPVVAVTDTTPEQLRELANRLHAVEQQRGRPTGDHPGHQWQSLGQFAHATAHADPEQARAWVDQVLDPDNAALDRPAWLTELYGLVERGRPFVTAVGGPRGIGESGTTIDWPFYGGSLAGLIAEQTAEKTEIASVKVSITKGSTGLRTFAGGSDLSYQLIERSTPSYLDLYLRIMAEAWARLTDSAAVDAAFAAAGDTEVLGLTPDADTIADAILAAGFTVVDAAGGRPVGAVATDLFSTLVTARDTNGRRMYERTGFASVNVDGVEVVREQNLAALTGVVTSAGAYAWHEDGPRTITAEHVALLGRDVAVYGYGAAAPYVPAGIVKLATA